MKNDDNIIEEYELVKRCLKGEKRAQKELFERFAPKMLGVCMRYAKDKPTAEDILQDGFIKVFNKLDTFRFEGSFEGWMRRIMVNTAIEKFRKTRYLRATVEIQDYHSPLVKNGVLDEMSREELLELVQDLPDGYRTVFNLYALEGYSHQEIAEELEISEGTSKSQLARARKLLQQKIAKLYQVEKAAYARAE